MDAGEAKPPLPVSSASSLIHDVVPFTPPLPEHIQFTSPQLDLEPSPTSQKDTNQLMTIHINTVNHYQNDTKIVTCQVKPTMRIQTLKECYSLASRETFQLRLFRDDYRVIPGHFTFQEAGIQDGDTLEGILVLTGG